jgi:Na+/phosphate symporter
MIIYTSALVCIIGLLMYALCTDGKLSEIGRIMFSFGLLAFLMTSVPHLVGVIR